MERLGFVPIGFQKRGTMIDPAASEGRFAATTRWSSRLSVSFLAGIARPAC